MAKAKRAAAKRSGNKAKPADKPAKAKTAGKAAAKATRTAATKKSARKAAAGKATRKTATKKPARKTAAGKTAAGKTVRKSATKKAAGKTTAKKTTRKTPARSAGTARAQKPARSSKRAKPASKAAKKSTMKKAAKSPAKKKTTARKSADKSVKKTRAAKPAKKTRAAPHKPTTKTAKAGRGHATAASHGSADAAKRPARKPAHVRPVGGVAARLSAAAAGEQTITREDGRYALPSSVTIELPEGYTPAGGEEYMNPRQLAYFRQKLRDWRDQLVEESRQTMENLRAEVRDVGDDAERATRETENSLELRTRDRYRKLISKIEKALRKIEEGRYGFCEETDEEIGLERLEARPIATLSLDAQERREHLQKQMGD